MQVKGAPPSVFWGLWINPKMAPVPEQCRGPKGRERAEPPERVHGNGTLACGAGLQGDGAQVTAELLVLIPPLGGQVPGKSTSSRPRGHLDAQWWGSYQPHVVFIPESET